MKLSEIPKEELLKELQKRANNNEESEGEYSLVIGTICDYPEGPAVEMFNVVEKPEDLPTNNYLLRARINGQRNYRLFYFKTNQFDKLKENLDRDWREFSRWVIETKSIKMFGI